MYDHLLQNKNELVLQMEQVVSATVPNFTDIKS